MISDSTFQIGFASALSVGSDSFTEEMTIEGSIGRAFAMINHTSATIHVNSRDSGTTEDFLTIKVPIEMTGKIPDEEYITDQRGNRIYVYTIPKLVLPDPSNDTTYIEDKINISSVPESASSFFLFLTSVGGMLIFASRKSACG
jgi:hypothetical protein